LNTLVRLNIALTLTLTLIMVNSAAAQTSEEFHPYLSNKFNIEAGVFWPKVNFTAAVDGSEPNDEIDIDEALRLEDYHSSLSAEFRWRFGEKWSFWAQYWGTDTDGSVILEEALPWEDVIFAPGTFATGGVSLDVTRLFVGRIFSQSVRHEFGAGFGVHWLQLKTFAEGEIIVDDDSLEFYSDSASADFPMPNIGAWYFYSWSPKWMAQARVDWLSASVGDYSGGIWDIQVGVNYQAFKTVGFGLYYKWFKLNGELDDEHWHGSVDLAQGGPLLTVSATW